MSTMYLDCDQFQQLLQALFDLTNEIGKMRIVTEDQARINQRLLELSEENLAINRAGFEVSQRLFNLQTERELELKKFRDKTIDIEKRVPGGL